MDDTDRDVKRGKDRRKERHTGRERDFHTDVHIPHGGTGTEKYHIERYTEILIDTQTETHRKTDGQERERRERI